MHGTLKSLERQPSKVDARTLGFSLEDTNLIAASDACHCTLHILMAPRTDLDYSR